jgi:ATP-dependent Lon protease
MDHIVEKVELLVKLLREKTEQSKGMVSIEKKVKEEMLPKKKAAPMAINSFIPNSQMNEKNSLIAKMKGKKLPERVQSEIEKEMKNMNFGSDKNVIEKYIETLL